MIGTLAMNPMISIRSNANNLRIARKLIVPMYINLRKIYSFLVQA